MMRGLVLKSGGGVERLCLLFFAAGLCEGERRRMTGSARRCGYGNSDGRRAEPAGCEQD